MAKNFSNKVTRRVATNSVFADIKNLVAATTSFNQGDLLILDTTNHIVAKAVNETDSTTFLGVAPVTVVNGKLPQIYSTDVDGSLGTPALPGPEFGDEYEVTLKASDVITPGAKLYNAPATGAGVVSVTGTKAIGVYSGPGLTAGASGTVISAKIGSRYPDDKLTF